MESKWQRNSKKNKRTIPQFWHDSAFAAPFLGLFMLGGDVIQYTARRTREGSRASTWICRINRAYVSRRHDTDEANSVTWLRRPIGLIKNLLEGPSAFLMQSLHSGFRQMFYSLCLNINGMWWMLNVFVDIFAQSPADYARGNCVCMCVFVCVRMLDWIWATHGLMCVCSWPSVGGVPVQCNVRLFGPHVSTCTSTRALDLLLLLK